MFGWMKTLKTELAIPIAILAALAVGGPIVAVNISGDSYRDPPPNAAERLIISDGFGVGSMIDLEGDTMMTVPIDVVPTVTP
jgi:hypothetical protein